MLHRLSRTLRQPFAILAILFTMLGGIAPAAATPVTTTDPAPLAQEGAATAVIGVTAFTCPPAVQPSASTLDASEVSTICPDPAPGVEFHLLQDDIDTTVATDAQGTVRFEFSAVGPVQLFAGVPLEADEALYCAGDDEVDSEFTAVTIDATGVSTFDLSTTSRYTCFWYLADPTAPVTTETPALIESTAATEVATDSTLDLFVFECSGDAVVDPAEASYDDLIDVCLTNGSAVDFNLQTADQALIETSDEDGQAEFVYPAGAEVDFFAAVPLETIEILYCSVSLGTPERLTRDEQGVFHWANAQAEERTCSWFLVTPPTATEEPTDMPATETATAAPTASLATEVPATTARIALAPVTCPDAFDPATAGTDLSTLAANCTEPVAGVSFTLGWPSGETDVRVSSTTEPVLWEALTPGSYTLVSSVPLEAATEYLGCQADGGAIYQKEFSTTGITTFSDLDTEQITCTWYIVPENSRGEETGSSLEIHLAICPVGHDGGNLFDTCHSNGLADSDFTITGPDGGMTAATAILQPDGPGVVTFTSLVAGDYTITGGPPGDFGKVELFCSTQPDNGTPTYSMAGAVGSLSLEENQHVLCDWYFIPDDNGPPTVTPTPDVTPEPARAEILVTLLACPAGDSGAYSGATLSQLQQRCTEKVNDVSFRLGDPAGVPLTARTGISGEGAVRFYDLLPGDLTMTPALPLTLRNLAVFCTINGGPSYQKALANGGTTFVDVDGESIACSWFAVKPGGGTGGGDTGSITIREYLCEKDRAEITDWDAECTPGSTGTSFAIANTSTGAARQGTPNAQGIHVFSGLPDGHYILTQATGQWCRAIADRVDSQSRVIVQGGGNTDVVLYQCNAVNHLPVTGSGPLPSTSPGVDLPLLSFAFPGVALPVACLLLWRFSGSRVAPVDQPGSTAITRSSRRWSHRYR